MFREGMAQALLGRKTEFESHTSRGKQASKQRKFRNGMAQALLGRTTELERQQVGH